MTAGPSHSSPLPPAMTQLADIAMERVQAAVKELLEVDSLRDVIEVHIGFSEIRAVVFATDGNGSKYAVRDEDGEMVAARHILSRRVVR